MLFADTVSTQTYLLGSMTSIQKQGDDLDEIHSWIAVLKKSHADTDHNIEFGTAHSCLISSLENTL